jgi:DNA-binding response OmpR family regulator
VQPLDVIVVEDDPSALLAITTLVRGLGYVCRAANSAEEALLLYEARPAAIVVSDWDLPGMSGTDLCRALKQRDPHAYVLLLTAFDEPGGVVDTQGRGVDDFLRKPVDIDELEARLRAAEGLVRAVQTLKVLATV